VFLHRRGCPPPDPVAPAASSPSPRPRAVTRPQVKKKEVLDKHLDFLLSQTERYSKVLAEELHGGKPSSSGALSAPSDAAAAAPAPAAAPPSTSPTDDADDEFVMDAAQVWDPLPPSL
jgi:hypothetical protein